MTIQDFQRRLSELLAESIGVPALDVAEELELQAQALRDCADEDEDA